MKARLLKHRIVTQIVRETTLVPEDFKKANGMPLRRLEDPATVAWKLGTAPTTRVADDPGSSPTFAPESAMWASCTSEPN